MKQIFLLPLLTLLLVAIALAQSAQDMDQDGVLDEKDVCPNTLTSAIIVDPLQYYDYAGCSCDQLEERINADNPCIEFFCHDEILQITEKSHYGSFVDCPRDNCVGTTLYDFPEDGYAQCVGIIPVNKTCDVQIVHNSSYCGYEPQNIDAGSSEQAPVAVKPIPQLTGNIETLYLTGATLIYQKPLFIEEDTLIEAIIIFDTNAQRRLFLDLHDQVPLNKTDVYCAEDVNDTLFCSASWLLWAKTAGTKNLALSLSYDPGDGNFIRENVSFSVDVNLPFVLEQPSQNVVAMSAFLEDDEEIFLKGVFDELVRKNVVDESFDFDIFLQKILNTSKHSSITRHVEVQDRTTTFKIALDPKSTLTDVMIIEYIPKEIAESVSQINFDPQPSVIINDDPMIMWHFSAVDERVEVSYEVDKETQMSGTTVAVADDIIATSTPWHIIIPLIIIPIIVVSLIWFSRREGAK